MKLPNFLKSDKLNALKEQMGRSPDFYGGFQVDPTRLTFEEREALESGGGIDVSFDQLTVLPDGTLAFKDSRVLLYIRDVHMRESHREDWYPRYHLSHCQKLKEMTAAGRIERYVISAETKGEFLLNVISRGQPRSERYRLPVCQLCLDGLSFEDFSLQRERSWRRGYVGQFSPASFFKIYPRSLHTKKPKYTSENAPLDNYPPDFPAISQRVREQANWCCSSCSRSFEARSLRRFLHTHHVNGDRRNNGASNLKALCIVCHAEEPMHNHLKRDPNYRECIRLLGLERIAERSSAPR